MFLTELEKIKNVYVHSRPDYSNLYDVMWHRQNENQKQGIEFWGKNRIQHLNQLCGVFNLSLEGAVVLDLCSGLGRISAACLEVGATKVVSADGSHSGLLNSREKFLTLGLDESRFDHVQLDVEKIDTCFKENTFDFVIHYYALQHIRDYRKTLGNIKAILKPGGYTAFNYFTTGTTSSLTRLLRDIFLKYDVVLIFNFLEELGFNKGSQNKFVPSDLLNITSKFDAAVYPFILDLAKLVSDHGHDAVASKLHFEDFTTPYLHNFDHNEIVDYVQNSLNLKIVNSSLGRIVAQKL